MKDAQIALRDRICEIGIAGLDGSDLPKIIETAIACSGACACFLGLLPDEARKLVVEGIAKTLSDVTELRAAEIQSGVFDRTWRRSQ